MRVEKAIKHKGDGGANSSWSTWNGHERLGNKIGGNRRLEEESRPCRTDHLRLVKIQTRE